MADGLLVLTADRVFDSATGRCAPDLAVVCSGARVDAVVPVAQAPAAGDVVRGGPVRRIDLPGHTLLPGLVDCHTHLVGEAESGQGYAHLVTRSSAQEVLVGVENARRTLRAGFTTVRDVGSFRAFADVALRDAVTAGWVEGPRMLCAGAYVTCPGGAGDVTGLAVDVDAVVPAELRFGVCSGPDGVRATVRRVLGRGADVVKVLATGAVLTAGTAPGAPELSRAEIAAAVEVATDHGTHVAAHAHGAEGIRRAVLAGVRSVEHGSLLDAGTVALMAEHGTYLVADLYDGDWILEQGPRLGFSEEVMRKTRDTTQAQRDGFAAAVDAGVRIAYGTDSGVYPHGDNGRQLAYYVRHGLTPAQALLSATRWAAELLGLEHEIGRLAPGLAADVVAVPGDPTVDVTGCERPALVVRAGRVVLDPAAP
ncbi:amidohydrolase family protein [Kineosporia sp. A_224]|uniref:metal-dependent hydrolase family protein n=1 Tax=Kineosporia sp. A_224 TaxID=1962180 RepID=UPI000B4BC691|nr:amidohydrolase family protein [Kineosporia sp. A_224]